MAYLGTKHNIRDANESESERIVVSDVQKKSKKPDIPMNKFDPGRNNFKFAKSYSVQVSQSIGVF